MHPNLLIQVATNVFPFVVNATAADSIPDTNVQRAAVAYRQHLRIDLLFNEEKTCGNLHAFWIFKPPIAEDATPITIGAATLKPRVAHVARLAAGDEITVLVVVMSRHHVLLLPSRSLTHGNREAQTITFPPAMRYLGANTRSAPPLEFKLLLTFAMVGFVAAAPLRSARFAQAPNHVPSDAGSRVNRFLAATS